ncbi:MAG: FeoB-associated Cys-rich membrane protein [Clostridiales bacterium]|jgi:hypothetical protein|nr:FeoB-associated Cys-rich membrane protein [Clostridiales bacterium]
MAFLQQNLATIITGAAVLAVTGLAVAFMIKNRREHKRCGGCTGCDEGGCPYERYGQDGN